MVAEDKKILVTASILSAVLSLYILFPLSYFLLILTSFAITNTTLNLRIFITFLILFLTFLLSFFAYLLFIRIFFRKFSFKTNKVKTNFLFQLFFVLVPGFLLWSLLGLLFYYGGSPYCLLFSIFGILLGFILSLLISLAIYLLFSSRNPA